MSGMGVRIKVRQLGSSLGERRTPMPHQNSFLDWARRRLRVPCFMEMRLGKSLSVKWWAQSFSPENVLIVGPLSTLSSWQDELDLEGIVPIVLSGKSSARLVTSRAYSGWFLINYEGLRLAPEIADEPWDAVILDESTRIRNPRAQITKLCLNSFGHVPNRAVLSGLPNPESLMDYWCQMAFLFDGWLGCSNYYHFRSKYFQKGNSKWSWLPKKGTRHAINVALETDAFQLTRAQAGIGSKKVFERRVIPMNDRQQKAHDLALKHMELELDGQIVETKWVISRIIWLARIAGGFHPLGPLLGDGKIKELVSLLTGELVKEQVLVWFRFRQEIDHVETALRKAKVSFDVIHGGVPPEKRRGVRQRFKKGDVRVLLLQVQTGRFGLDLSASSTAIYYSNTYVGEDRAQSEDRLVHPKKNEPLLYIDLVSKGSIDQEIVAKVRMKKSLSKLMMTEILRCLARRSQ